MTIFQHFTPEEKPFIEKMLEWVQVVDHRGITKRTDFLDPRQAEIVQSIVNRTQGVAVDFFGGYNDAERVRAVITPEYIQTSIEDFGVTLIEIENKNPFSNLSHRDYLGALLALGVIRDKFGDLLVHESYAQLLIEAEMVDYVKTHLQQVGKSTVIVTERTLDQIQLPNTQLDERVITVPSMRLDAVLADVLRLSRTKVQTVIKSGKVKVNWKTEDASSAELKEGDVLSVRGFGRFRIVQEKGTSKKGNIILTIGFYKEN